MLLFIQMQNRQLTRSILYILQFYHRANVPEQFRCTLFYLFPSEELFFSDERSIILNSPPAEVV
jgi:hypothetical protein